jgi:hypothetical protein
LVLGRAEAAAFGVLKPNTRAGASSAVGTDALEQFVQAVRAAPSERERVALVNEQLAEVARLIDVGAEVPAVAGRIALSASVALALLELVPAISGGRPLHAALASIVAGVLAYIGCSEIGRRARQSGRQLRSHWNALSGALLGRRGLADRGKVPLS